MQKLIGAAVVLMLSVLIVARCGATEPREGVRDIMRVKLDHAQAVVEALAREDYDALGKHAQHLALLSLDAGWRVLQTDEYAQHSNDFRRHAHAIRDAAKKRNIDGAALAYVQLTLSCVNCHKYVRSTRTARRDSDASNENALRTALRSR
jgi:hypothetical protein